MTQKVWTGKEVEKILLMAQDTISLNTPVSTEEDSDVEIGGLIEDPGPGPEELVLKEGTRSKLLEYMNKYLTPREVEILKLRFGFETSSPMTLQEIAKEFGIVRERVRQIEARALRKLRYKFFALNLIMFHFLI